MSTTDDVTRLQVEFDKLKDAKQRKEAEKLEVLQAAAAQRAECMRLRSAGLPTTVAENALVHLQSEAAKRQAIVEDLRMELEVLAGRLQRARERRWIQST